MRPVPLINMYLLDQTTQTFNLATGPPLCPTTRHFRGASLNCRPAHIRKARLRSTLQIDTGLHPNAKLQLNVNFYSFDRVFSDRFFFGFRIHVVATTVCTTESVHTLTCRTHIFLLHSLSAYIHTTLCVSHTRMAQGHQKGSLHMCRFSPSRLLPFHDSPRLLCCFRSLTSRPLLTATSPTIPST